MHNYLRGLGARQNVDVEVLAFLPGPIRHDPVSDILQGVLAAPLMAASAPIKYAETSSLTDNANFRQRPDGGMM